MSGLAGLKLSSPLISSAGVQNGTDETLVINKFNELVNTNLGAITLGLFTVAPYAGHEAQYGPPVYYYDEHNRLTYNSMGSANIGIDAAIKAIPKLVNKAHKENKILIYDISPLGSKEYGGAVDQLVEMVEKLLPTSIDLIEINISTPNRVAEDGRRLLPLAYDIKTVIQLIKVLTNYTNKKIGIKVPPYLTKVQLKLAKTLAEYLLDTKVCSFITVSNTIPGQIPKDKKGKNILSVPDGKGGMSGPGTKEEGRRQLKLWRDLVGERIDIISLLGVDSHEEFKLRLKMGAKAAGGVTFLRESHNFKKAVNNILTGK